MADPNGIVKCRLQVIPRETVASTTQSSVWSNVNIESTLAPILTSSWDSESIVYSDSGRTSFGYLNGNVYYQQVTTTSTNTLSTGITNVEFVYFKHSGYRFSSAQDATCDTTNTDATVTCDANSFIDVGFRVSGTGITAGTTIASINSGTVGTNVTSFELSAAATASNTNTTLTFYNHQFTSDTANTADFLEIRGDADDGFVIAVLGPGEAIALPIRSSSGWGTSADRIGTTNYYFQSVDPDDLTAGSNSIAMEFLAGTHS